MVQFQAKNIFYIVSSIFLTISLGWALITLAAQLQPTQKLTVAFLDVGQGDATLITAPNGVQVLIDAGVGPTILRSLHNHIPLRDTTIDVFIASHFDMDHVGGLQDVFIGYNVQQLLFGFERSDVYPLQSISVPHQVVRTGDRVTLDPQAGVFIDILSPPESFKGVDENDRSVVVRLVYNETCFLFTGDSSVRIERFLIEGYGDALRCDVLQVGHHGSDTSTSELFVGFVQPQYAIISVGADNQFGHPHQEVLDILQSFAVNVLRTDQQGTIVLVSDGVQIEPQN